MYINMNTTTNASLEPSSAELPSAEPPSAELPSAEPPSAELPSTQEIFHNHFVTIGNSLYAHITQPLNITYVNFDEPVPIESGRDLHYAIESINNYNTQYEILRNSYQSSNYYLILTKFENKFYKIFYQYNDGNQIQYSINSSFN